jgi:hypothetical protein
MGLLDEAIREHLELKRRRGADPTEVERLEREALGPVRRVQQEPPAADASDLVAELSDQGPDEAAEAADLGHEHELAHEAEYESLPEPPDEPAAHGVVPEPESVPAADEAPHPRPSNRPVYEDPGVETAEYDVEAEHAQGEDVLEEPPAKDDDVLEETPEFLQDTPDHDRLWFEQRPPKDFDFDG